MKNSLRRIIYLAFAAAIGSGCGDNTLEAMKGADPEIIRKMPREELVEIDAVYCGYLASLKIDENEKTVSFRDTTLSYVPYLKARCARRDDGTFSEKFGVMIRGNIPANHPLGDYSDKDINQAVDEILRRHYN